MDQSTWQRGCEGGTRQTRSYQANFCVNSTSATQPSWLARLHSRSCVACAPSAVLMIIVMLTLSETIHKGIITKKTKVMRKELGRGHLVSSYETTGSPRCPGPRL